MEFQKKIVQLLRRAKLRNTYVDFDNFYRTQNKYTYQVTVMRSDFLNSYDRPSASYLNNKIFCFNKTAQTEISYVDKIYLSQVSCITSYEDSVKLKLHVAFKPKVKKCNEVQLTLL